MSRIPSIPPSRDNRIRRLNYAFRGLSSFAQSVNIYRAFKWLWETFG